MKHEVNKPIFWTHLNVESGITRTTKLCATFASILLAEVG